MINDIIIPIKQPCKGYYLRWYYNGWHYWFFLPGKESLQTIGQSYNTISKKPITISSGAVDMKQIIAIRTITCSKSVALYTDNGWMTTLISPGSFEIKNNYINGHEIELTIIAGSREVSNIGYSPISAITDSSFLNGNPFSLVANGIDDSRVGLSWSNGSTNQDGSEIYYSTDGINYSLHDIVYGSISSYIVEGLSSDTYFYFKVRAYKGTQQGDYSNVANAYTYYAYTLTSTGSGTGISTLRLKSNLIQTIKITDAGKFYTDSGATIGESNSFDLYSDTLSVVYLKVTSGTAKLLIKSRYITEWGNASLGGWLSSTDAPSLSGSISVLISLSIINISGNNTISGSIAGLTSLTNVLLNGSPSVSGSVANLTLLTRLAVYGTNTLSGSISNLTSLTYLAVSGSNTLSGSISGLTLLTYLGVSGSNTLSGSITNLTSLVTLFVVGSNTIAGSITNLTSLVYLYVVGFNTINGEVTNLTSLSTIIMKGNNTVSGDFGYNNSANGCIAIELNPCAMVNYTAGATWSNANVSIYPSIGYGLSSSEVDNMLIDMSNSGTMNGKTILLMGSNAARTAASNSAVATLVAAGCTVTTN
jgi:hypothetical protein